MSELLNDPQDVVSKVNDTVGRGRPAILKVYWSTVVEERLNHRENVVRQVDDSVSWRRLSSPNHVVEVPRVFVVRVPPSAGSAPFSCWSGQPSPSVSPGSGCLVGVGVVVGVGVLVGVGVIVGEGVRVAVGVEASKGSWKR